ncbi:MAG: hypothetical protein ACT4N8_06220 [Sphingosinicella sp.]|uniref:hypothetical protein n=1 Tax=Sphingosinicella sp. TaxID=1917971 RepID=UPI0040382B3D
MGYWSATLARSLLGRRPELICEPAIWEDGVAELARRTLGGHRESGAFLLGEKGSPRRIHRFVYYDDIDPNALDTGIVLINGRLLGDLWKICREEKLEVVADVHVHPGCYRQSASDKANPIIPEADHLALILPNFAEGSNLPGAIGVHRYLGNRRWRDESERWFPPFHMGWYAWL